LTQHYILLQRNLIYTAITRGRRLVVLVGTRRALAMAVARNDQHKRYTGLCQTPDGRGAKGKGILMMAETVQLAEGVSIEVGAGLRVQVEGIDFTFTSRFLGTLDTDDVLDQPRSAHGAL
jgi:hypothetical protein